VLRSW